MEKSKTPSIPMITGLFSVQRNGKWGLSSKMLREMTASLRINPWYRRDIFFLAGDEISAKALERVGLPIFHIFEDAPLAIRQEPAFWMKHWMVFWALQKFGEVIWVDWDTINLIYPDERFFSFCREFNTPKFVFIPGYHATVNCSVYYVSHDWLEKMKRSFSMPVSSPNDELIWRNVLPKDVIDRREFWWGDKVINVWLEEECSWIKEETYFVHVKTFSYLKRLMKEKNKINFSLG